MVAYARKVLDAASANENDRVFLKVVSFATDVANNFVAVGKANFRHLSESGVRLFRGHGIDLGTNSALLRGVEFAGFALDGVLNELKRGRLALAGLVLARSADELIDGRHGWMEENGLLTLGPLGSLARLVETRLLTFDRAGVTSKEPRTAKHLLKVCRGKYESAGKSVTNRFDLCGFTPSLDLYFETRLVLHGSEFDRSEERSKKVAATNVLIESLSIDEGLTRFEMEADLGNGGLATADGVEVFACGRHTRFGLRLYGNGFGLLSFVAVGVSGFELEAEHHSIAETVFGKHSKYGVANDFGRLLRAELA